ncbi:MAG: Sua5/YciO/YrdC/YwlC family protein, partial [Chitinophagaceae bacterium]
MQIDDDIKECLRVLKNGGTILYPTDTVWGIGCDATNPAAVEKIFRIKKRNEEKSMIILLADEEDILQYVNEDNPAVYDFIQGVNKPVTVIYSRAKNLAPNVINKDGSIGIRIVADDFCKRLIRELGKPIVSTSSNISGYPPPAIFRDIDRHIIECVDYVV